VLVLLMTIPGLALFYGGLVRSKNTLSVLAHVSYTVCIVTLIWVIYGYSLAFTGGSWLIGGFDKVFLRGVTTDSQAATFSVGVTIHELVYIAFQMTFAAITPALIVGAFVERMRFAAVALFVPLWVTFVYIPIAHMVWYWAGPDAIDGAAKALAAATDDVARAAAKSRLDEVLDDAGLIFRWGAIDFAGGTVVHINSGIAGLVGALVVGKRIGYGKEIMAPHSLTLSMVGASLLWVGWFGFNAGSNLEASGGAALAMINSFVATAGAALSWMFAEWMSKGKPSLLGILSGCVALGGVGIMDYTVGKIADYDFSSQLWAQIKAVVTTLIWSGLISFILYKLVDILVGLREPIEKEREGLDISDHGERAYTV
jgi:Amt family ammonium transporter